MAVRFIIGRAGTGKTRHCFDAIVADMRAEPLNGPPIYWILPKQATFSAERELTTQSGLEAFTRARAEDPRDRLTGTGPHRRVAHGATL